MLSADRRPGRTGSNVTGAATNENSINMRDYVAVLRRRRLLIAFTLLLVTGLVGAYSFTRPPLYASTASVLVRPVTQSPFANNDPVGDLVSLDTERQLVLSSAVAEMVREDLGWPITIDELLDRVAVETPAETQVLRITFRDSNPEDAQLGAQAFADAYLEFKTRQAREFSLRQSATIQAQIEELQGELATANQQLDEAGPSSTEERNAQAQVDELQALITLLRGELTSISTLIINPGQVVGLAALPPEPENAHARDLAVGVFLGAFLAIGLAFLRDRTADRLRGRGELEALIRAPVLAIVPRIRGWRRRRSAMLVTRTDPLSPAAEAYRTLRTTMSVMAAQRQVRAVTVLSATEGEGKTTTAANLGVVLAEAGHRVLLISADLRRPRLHSFFGVRPDPGLSNIVDLAHDAGRWRTKIPNLWVIPSGPPAARPDEILDSDPVQRLLTARPPDLDFIVIDCPPVIPVADALVLALLSDGVLFVADAESARRAVVAEARDQLEQVGATVLGGILNNVDSSGPSYGYGHYRQFRAKMSVEDSNGQGVAGKEPSRRASGADGWTREEATSPEGADQSK